MMFNSMYPLKTVHGVMRTHIHKNTHVYTQEWIQMLAHTHKHTDPGL